MARARSYSVAFQNVPVSAVQDLIALYCGASMACELHGVQIGQITGTNVQNLRVSIKRLPATVTAGTGGSSATPRSMLSGDAAATATARANDATTQASTSGTPQTLHADVMNTVNGFSFFWPPNDIPTFKPGEACVLSLDTAPSSALTMSGTLYFGELF